MWRSMGKNINLNRYLLVVLIGASAAVCAGNPENSVAPPGMIFELLALNHDIPTKQWPRYRSVAALVPSSDGRYLYVAEQTAKRISVVHLLSKTVKKIIQLPNEVTGIAVAPSGKLYAACASDWWPGGMVCEVDAALGKVLRRLPGGQGARSPVVSPDGKTLYVCNQHGNDVSIVDIASGALVKKLYAYRQPFSAALTPDGSVLVVANCIPVQKSTDQLNIASRILLINTVEQKVESVIPLPIGSHSVFNVAISPDGSYAYASHLVGMFTLPAIAIEGGWIHTNNIAVIDIKKKRLLNDFPLDDAKHGAANPWGIACTKDKSIVCVMHAGSNEMTVIDVQNMMKAAIAKKDTITLEKDLQFIGCSHDFSALTNCKYRVPILGKGPRAVAIIGKRAYTAGYFGDTTGSNTIEMFDLALGDNATKPAGTISLGPAQGMNGTRKGEMAFCDGTLCYEKWQSCFSCHPSVRSDGLNWMLSNDVTTDPKNAKSMLYSWWTPRMGWAGKRAHASESIRLGFKNSLFAPTNYELSSYIDTFFMHIKPVPSPYLVKGRLSPAAEKGRKVFREDPLCDCISCHMGPLYTDMAFHPSGIPKWNDSPNWDTPTIMETWRDGPYGHIGSFDKIEDIIGYEGHSMSLKKGLSEEKFSDLIQFVLSL
jgi:YVTN family beta-propeller protein